MNSQSPIYSLKFTISWIIVYALIVFTLFQIISRSLAFLANYSRLVRRINTILRRCLTGECDPMANLVSPDALVVNPLYCPFCSWRFYYGHSAKAVGGTRKAYIPVGADSVDLD